MKDSGYGCGRRGGLLVVRERIASKERTIMKAPNPSLSRICGDVPPSRVMRGGNAMDATALTTEPVRPCFANFREVPMAAMVAGLALERITALWEDGGSRIDVAIHELESRSIILWGAALDRFLRAYLLEHPTGDLPLDDTELSERFEVAFDEATQPLTRYLLKTALCDGPALSLAQLAARRYKPNTSSFRKLQRHLLRATVYPMRDLCLWSVEVQERTLNNGKTAIASYRISAGPALLAFHRHVYLPWRTRQLRAFCSQHLGKD